MTGVRDAEGQRVAIHIVRTRRERRMRACVTVYVGVPLIVGGLFGGALTAIENGG